MHMPLHSDAMDRELLRSGLHSSSAFVLVTAELILLWCLPNNHSVAFVVVFVPLQAKSCPSLPLLVKDGAQPTPWCGLCQLWAGVL